MEPITSSAKVEISPVGTITSIDWKKIGKGALIAAGGGLAVYVAGILQTIDWSTIGKYGILLAPIASIIINILDKWVTSNANVKEIY